jgi:glutamate dehydrogenase/leucine dehydrogenase
MKDLLKQFESSAPEIEFHWTDSETNAEGWCVINSLRGGAAGGGTRMSLNVDRHEVLSLAKTMEIKFSVAGPQIGGAKSGIRFDPSDPRKADVLKRWYTALKPLLKSYYGTGGDMNVDEIHEVIPITKELGIDHPQEGVFQGHFQPNPESKALSIKRLQEGVLLPLFHPEFTPISDGTYTVADMITGYGVAESVRHYGQLYQWPLEGKRAIIQGWGNVASAAAWYLSRMGVRIVGIIDKKEGLLSTEGLDHKAIQKLFVDKKGNSLASEHAQTFEDVNAKIWDIGAEIFIPAAASRLLTKDQLDRMIKKGLELISSGANVPFADQQIFYGEISEHADTHVSCIPDFISNCGMARVFAYLMNPEGPLTEVAIFNDASDTIRKGMEDVFQKDSNPKKLTATAYSIALNKLLNA